MKKALSLVLTVLLVFSTLSILASMSVSEATTDEYFIYSKFDPPGVDDVVGAAGYVEYYGVPEWGDEIQYVYFLSGDIGYKVKVWVTDGDGDGKIEPRQHPDHYLSEYRGPIEPRNFSIVSSKDLSGYTGGSGWHTEEFYVDSSGVYLGAYPNGIHKWDHDWNYTGKVADSPPERTESMAYNPAENVWYAGGRYRTIYQLNDTDNDGSFLDESWVAIFTYPSYEGGHHDGMEYVGGYLWISDMTSDVIGKWQYNATTDTWEELKRFTYNETKPVEGMGFGPNDHFWAGSGWGSDSYIYELGNEITKGYPIAEAGPDVEAHPPTVPITFDASGSHHTDPAKEIGLYEWDFESDGTWDYSGTDLTVEHAYPAYYNPDGSIDWDKTAKNYTATLRVTDNSAPPIQDIDVRIVHITAPPWKPVADPDGPYEGLIGIWIPLDGSKSYDPESIMYRSDHPWYETIQKYEWDLDNDGKFDDATGPQPTHSWSSEGIYLIGLKVTDSQPSGPGGSLGDLDIDIEYTTVIVKSTVRVAAVFAKFTPEDPKPTHFSYDDYRQKLVDYFDEVSYSAIHLSLDFYGLESSDWKYSVTNDHDHYGNREYDFCWDSILAADSDVPYRIYDIIVLVHSGNDEAFSKNPSDMWSQFLAHVRKTPAGDEARNWIVVAETDEWGVWAHEIGHALGQVLVHKTLPDRYKNGWIGAWGLMGLGGLVAPPTHLSSYSKEFLDLLQYKEISYGTYWVNSLETSQLNDEVPIFKYKKVWYEIPNYYILEARDVRGRLPSSIDYALLLYDVDVRLLQSDTVNLLPKPTYWTGRQVLSSEGDEYKDPDAQVKFRLVDQRTDSDKLEIQVSVENYVGQKLKGASLTSPANVLAAVSSILNVPPETVPSLPDLDLHAYTNDGKHVGVNYQSGVYETQILEAFGSGDLLNGREWIFVPEELEVYFVVSAKDIAEFLNATSEAHQLTDGIEDYIMSIVYYDQGGTRYESTPVSQEIAPGDNVSHRFAIIKNPDGTYTPILDNKPPTLSVYSPENKTYTTTSVSLNFTVNEATSWIGYSLDGQANVTITGNITLSGLSDGSHSLRVYAKDAAGNIGASEIIHFSIETPEPVLTWIVAAIVIIVAIGTAIYLLKIRKKSPRVSQKDVVGATGRT